MPRKSQRGPEAEPAPGAPGSRQKSRTGQVRLDADLAEMVQIIVSAEGMSSAKLLSPLVRDFVERRYQEVVRKLHERAEGLKRPK